MTGVWRPERRRWIVGAVPLAFVVAVSMATGNRPAAADHCDTEALSGLLIGDDDVPVGFEVLPEATGELDTALLRQFAPGQDVSAFEQICGYARVWGNIDGDGIQATVWDLRSEERAGQMLTGISNAQKRVVSRFDAPGITGETALVLEGRAPSPQPGKTVLSVFRSGHHVFAVAVGAAEADLATASRLTAAQIARSPSGSEGTGQPVSWTTITGQMTGSFLGSVVLYLLVVAAVTRWRDPLRKRRRRPRVPTKPDGAVGVAVDVSASARRRRLVAGIGFASRILGLSLLLPGLTPLFWPQTLLLAGPGAVLASGIPFRLRRRSKGGPGRERRLFTGRRAIRVSLLFTVALALFAAAVMLAFVGVLESGRDGPLVVTEPSGDHRVVSEETLKFLPYVLAVAAVAVAVRTSRRARRLAALDAQALMERDARPIVLYLRSFSDDNLRIRAGVTERRSLLERLSPRRFDRFEEVLAWRLNEIGPVVALNPPDTKLSPLGAARTTLGNDEWQHTIGAWMREAALIVVAAPPSHPTPGLRWELERIESEGLWPKTVFVLPAVPDEKLHARWPQFAPLLDGAASWAGELPVDPARMLLGSIVPGAGWLVVTADERTEWSYTEAVRVAAAWRQDSLTIAVEPSTATS